MCIVQHYILYLIAVSSTFQTYFGVKSVQKFKLTSPVRNILRASWEFINFILSYYYRVTINQLHYLISVSKWVCQAWLRGHRVHWLHFLPQVIKKILAVEMGDDCKCLITTFGTRHKTTHNTRQHFYIHPRVAVGSNPYVAFKEINNNLKSIPTSAASQGMDLKKKISVEWFKTWPQIKDRRCLQGWKVKLTPEAPLASIRRPTR